MSTNDPARRGFLRSLVTLPLVGGGLTLIGSPSAAAEPVTDALLYSYSDWLFMEQRYLRTAIGTRGHVVDPNSPGGRYHWQSYGEPGPRLPSTRAAVVLAAVGCNWREDGR